MNKLFSFGISIMLFSVCAFSVYAQCIELPDSREELTIISANYHAPGDVNYGADIKEQLNNHISNNCLYYHLCNFWHQYFDPAPGADKILDLEYKIGDITFSETINEDELIIVNKPQQNPDCCEGKIIKAEYGYNQGENTVDITDKITEFVVDCKLDWTGYSSRAELGVEKVNDKKIFVEYEIDGNRQTAWCYYEGNPSEFVIDLKRKTDIALLQKPEISSDGAVVEGKMTIEIDSDIEDAQIRYTLNASSADIDTPSMSDEAYTAAFTIDTATVVAARVFVNDLASETAIEEFSCENCGAITAIRNPSISNAHSIIALREHVRVFTPDGMLVAKNQSEIIRFKSGVYIIKNDNADRKSRNVRRFVLSK